MPSIAAPPPVVPPALARLGAGSDGIPVYTLEDIARPPAGRAEVAAALAAGLDPARTPIVVLGEAHGEESDRRFRDAYLALQAAGKPMALGVELPTNARLDGLVRDLQGGRLAEAEFLRLGGAELAAMYNANRRDLTVPGRDAAAYRERLTQDVVLPTRAGLAVVLLDANRYGRSGDRDTGMADAAARAAQEVIASGRLNGRPAKGLLIQTGMLHAGRQADAPVKLELLARGGTGDQRVVAGDRRVAPFGQRPATELLAERFGADRVLSVLFDPVASDPACPSPAANPAKCYVSAFTPGDPDAGGPTEWDRLRFMGVNERGTFDVIIPVRDVPDAVAP